MSSWIVAFFLGCPRTYRRDGGWIQITNMQIVARQLRTLRMWQTSIYHKAIALRWRNIQRHWSNSLLGHPYPPAITAHTTQTRAGSNKRDKSHGWLSKGPGGQYSSDSSPTLLLLLRKRIFIIIWLWMMSTILLNILGFVPLPQDHRLCPSNRRTCWNLIKYSSAGKDWRDNKGRQDRYRHRRMFCAPYPNCVVCPISLCIIMYLIRRAICNEFTPVSLCRLNRALNWFDGRKYYGSHLNF